jgi:protein-L-isoaspartate(D-aspartate) O-methyltransferase
MLAIPRQYFVTEDLLPDAYSDNPLRFSRMGFNISFVLTFSFAYETYRAPHMHAMCLENMDIQPGNIVLDIGSGSGLLTAYAAYLTGPVSLSIMLDLTTSRLATFMDLTCTITSLSFRRRTWKN